MTLSLTDPFSNNTTAPAWVGVTVASGGSGSTGNVYLAETPEHFSYDADGNLTNDGRWSYTWDAENRLTGMAANTAVGPQYQIAFAYDAKGRRIQKTVTNGSSVNTVDLLYDGWNLLAELQANHTLVRSYVWGNDLSGSIQGAGGVGGLLEVSYSGGSVTNCFAAFDGNGNVAALVKTTDGTSVANYEYGPFGEVIRSTGPMAKVNPMRFSTKYQDDESDLFYYGYRYYKPSAGTWLSRDPYTESGGINLYSYVNNAPTISIDPLGKTTRSGGSIALNPTDVTFEGKKIGSVQAWKNTSAGTDYDAMWMELDKDPGCPTCKWTQFTTRHQYDSTGKEGSSWLPMYMVYCRQMGLRYLDVLASDGNWWWGIHSSDANVEAMWDQPSGYFNDQWVKYVGNFDSFLICQTSETDCNGNTTVKWKPAFQVTWSATQTKSDSVVDNTRVYDVSHGGSITTLPAWANIPQWLWGNDYDNGKPGGARFVANPTF
ncbi:MAG: RHS repeat-associated core domain-containing protein [Negativicutes bacterium]|nr:RHS repeat-associated core domain-containing protein [Negativicutes bacterium]